MFLRGNRRQRYQTVNLKENVSSSCCSRSKSSCGLTFREFPNRPTKIKIIVFSIRSETNLFIASEVRILFILTLNVLQYINVDFSLKFEKVRLQLVCNMPSVTGLNPFETFYQLVSFARQLS